MGGGVRDDRGGRTVGPARSLAATVWARLTETGPTVVVECRDCGASVPADADTCPNCDSGEVARYELG